MEITHCCLPHLLSFIHAKLWGWVFFLWFFCCRLSPWVYSLNLKHTKTFYPFTGKRETAPFQDHDRQVLPQSTPLTFWERFWKLFYSFISVQLKCHVQQCHNTITTKATKFLCRNTQGLILELLNMQWHILSLQMAPILFRNNTLGLVLVFISSPKSNELKFFSCAEEVAATTQNLFRQAVEIWGLKYRQNK